MNNKQYSNQQLKLLKIFKNSELRRINILTGSVRSGKTWISLVLWAFWIAIMPKDGQYLMCAKTLVSLKRNVLDLLQNLVGSKHFSYSITKKEAILFGRLIYLEGANDERAEMKIRGLTLAGAYCDELSLLPEEFFTMLLSRLSVTNAKLFATTNPDCPTHWLKKNYIDRQAELDILVMKFLLTDNPFLDEEYIKSLQREFAGVFYERFILGNWVVAEGLVYPMFDEKVHVDNFADIDKSEGLYYISIDYGTVNPFSMGLWRILDGRAIRLKEFYYDGRKVRVQKTDEEYYNELVKIADGVCIQSVIVDPSAASFIETIRRHGQFSVRRADNHVLDGIRVVSSFLSSGKILFDGRCSDCIREFGLYSWDTSAQDDKVIKENDHAMDEVRYFCNTILKRMINTNAHSDNS